MAPVLSATRHADLNDLAQILTDQQGRKVDVVVDPRSIRAQNGNLVIADVEPVLSADGVTITAGHYRPTQLCEANLADKLVIPKPYLDRMRQHAIDLYDLNVNGWLDRTEPDKRYLLRGFRGDGDGPGVARAFLSDGYKMIENLDVLVAALDGIRRSGLDPLFAGCDLTDRRMYVRVVAPQIRALAPQLLHNYRSPFSGALGADNPVMFAGFVLTNSETGAGAFSIVPRIVAQVCDNGYTVTKDATRNVHLGGRLDEGVIDWSETTKRQHLELITSKASDAVSTFLSPGYLESKIAEMEREAGAEISDAERTIKVLGERLTFTEDQRAAILTHFIKGADATAGGIAHAITSVARELDDADVSHDMENKALRAMTLAARV